MKTKIRTKELEFKRDCERQLHERCVVEYDIKFVIRWQSEETFASVTVFGKDAEAVADSIRRLLLHKYPFPTPIEPR
jgi:hypothetical protein